MRKPARAQAGTRPIRCAIYTRKSSEDGLEQDFNSLDAQREACEAFIASQKHEGWVCLPAMYDDGGVSGATLERPALQRLIAEIKAGRIDTVVVYKVDRLTRSLGDFVRVVEIFDARRVSFVSVTQQFNTTTSMGRLTLNMLLSFAQFEREVTGERIRDKIAASKKKGMWMGGLPPLGYDVKDRKLVVNEAEAATVRHIYARYAALGSVRALQQALDREGVVSKLRSDRYGRRLGGKPLARGALYLMLQNRLYRGETVHKEKSYPGEHPAIIDAELWQQVQARLAANRVGREHKTTTVSLLAGLLYDGDGQRMTPSHANKRGTRYRYYVSQPLVIGSRAVTPRARRVPAGELEALVEDRLCRFLAEEANVFEALTGVIDDAAVQQAILARAGDLAAGWDDLAPAQKRAILQRLIERIELRPTHLDIRLRPAQLVHVLIHADDAEEDAAPADDDARSITLTVAASLQRVGMEVRLLIEGHGTRRTPDRSLLRLLGQAHRFQQMILRGDGRSIAELAAEAGVSGSYFSHILRLSFLAPDIVQAIVCDRHPLALSAQRLVRGCHLPIAWAEQRTQLGIR